MATVYEGSRLTGFDHAPVAIERLQDGFEDDKAITGRFLQEGMLGLALAHPDLAKVYELDRDQAGDLGRGVAALAGRQAER